ncbi:chlorinating enzyme [Massilia sp. PAMC28688]|uniref:chlorinating enzyme n=1 Tax=Massilia sp. PAMC28688 TaxID=2861283 RepID=UPI001C6370C0|nr:chlorinating enzyme [Massilia sp. PAMC28688]QYF92623.1 chlorinating enzyme [Massilia sp. PAMC28688]
MTNENVDYGLTPDEIEFFFKNGYVKPFKVYEPEEMEAHWKKVRLQTLNRKHAVYGENTLSNGKNNNLANYDRHLDIGFLGDHVCHPKIVHKVRSLMGPNLLCWKSEFFSKYPGDAGTDWHQAESFAGVAGRPHIEWPDNAERKGTLTAWCAFTDAMIDTACLAIVPGTHNMMFYDETKRLVFDPERNNNLVKNGVHRGLWGYDYRDLQKDPNWVPDESQAVYLEMKRGEVVIFWSTVLHSSLPHLGKTQEMRLGFSSRYVPPEVRIHPDSDVLTEFGGEVSLENYGAIVVAGENNYTHNKIRDTNMLGQPFKRV